MNRHYQQNHLPALNLVCKFCISFIHSFIHNNAVSNHVLLNHPEIINSKEDHGAVHEFTANANSSEDWLKENSIFGTHFLPGIEHPVSLQLYKWFV